MRRVIPLFCVVLLLTTAASAFAQHQRLFAVMPHEVVELDPRPASVGAVLRRFPVPAGLPGHGAVSFGGGQFLAWTAGAAVVLLDTQSGAIQQFTFPGFSPSGVLGTDGSARLLVLGSNGAGRRLVLVADARSMSTRVLDVGRVSDTQTIAYAAASDVLFVARPIVIIFGQTLPRLVDVLHASTGTLLKTLDVSPVLPFGLTTNAAGTRLFVTYEGGTFAFDVVSGTQVASNTSDQPLKGIPSLAQGLDEQRNRLVVSVRPGIRDYEAFAGISAYSADSLQFIGNVRVPELPLPSAGREVIPALTQEIDFSGQSATVFALQGIKVSRGKYYTTTTCHESQLTAIDAQTGAVRRTISMTAALGPGACEADLVRITEPAPPPGLTADVSGHQVTLHWQPPLGATQYEIEAGSAPGLANAATIASADPQLVVDDVPSGVYYVRVRAINTIGKSAASQAIQLVVP